MPIEMPKGLPFSVDTWTPPSKRSKRHHFLTHAHKDHLSNIPANAFFPIYATRLTTRLLLHSFPQLDKSLFVHIEVGESVSIDDPDGAFSVTAFDANHCPGAVMFLFEGEFGNVLHTGDCRLTPDCLQNLPLKYIARRGKEALCRLDYLFLDCTFGRCHLKMPSKQASIQQVISCVWKHPHAPVVYLSGDLLGQVEILVEVCKTFGSKIFVDKVESPECFQALSLVAPEILSEDFSSRFQVIAFSRFYEKAGVKLTEARANLQPEPLFIRPSAQWYATYESCNKSERQKPSLEEAERDQFGVWHVCFSMHSSREELEWALQFIKPKWVISTTPPCRAMELNYVKHHCYKTQLTPDDPLWKLFKGGTGKSTSLLTFSVSEVLLKNSVSVPVTEVSTIATREQIPESSSTSQFQLKLDSSPSRPQPITLFGRARIGLRDLDVTKERHDKLTCKEAAKVSLQPDACAKQTSSVVVGKIAGIAEVSAFKNDLLEQVSSSLADKITKPVPINPEEANERKDMQLFMSSKNVSVSECNFEEFKEEVDGNIEKSDELTDAKRTIPTIGSSLGLNPSLRKLYRSMNVPIPRPLPSLVELMGTCKRAKISSG